MSVAKAKEQIVSNLAEQTEKDLAVMLAAKNRNKPPLAIENLPPPENLSQPAMSRADRRARLEAAIDAGRPVLISLKEMKVQGNVREVVDVDCDEFKELMASIADHGLEQSFLLAYKPVGEEEFELIVVCGQRRKLAMEKLSERGLNGFDKAPAIVRRYTNDEDLITWGLAENLNRQNLHIFDVGQAYAGLMKLGVKQPEIESRWKNITGHGTSMISRAATAARFPVKVKNLMRANPHIFKTSVICNQFAAHRGSLYKNDDDLLAATEKLIAERGQVVKEVKESVAGRELETLWGIDRGVLKGRATGDRNRGRVVLEWKSESEFEEVVRLFSKP